MNPRPLTSIVTALLACGAGALHAANAPAAGAAPAPAAGKSAVANPLTVRFKQVQERIAALYQHRNEAPPPPDPRFNPFRTPGTAQVPPPKVEGGDAAPGAADGQVPDRMPSSNLALLQQGAATLKFGGTLEIGGRARLLINARTYKEGDVVQTQVRGEAIYLRIKEIAGRSVTLSLNDAEMTLKF